MIAERGGAKLVKMPQLCDGAPGTSTYIQLMDHNVKAVEEALKK
jgi:hypothetical protein